MVVSTTLSISTARRLAALAKAAYVEHGSNQQDQQEPEGRWSVVRDVAPFYSVTTAPSRLNFNICRVYTSVGGVSQVGVSQIGEEETRRNSLPCGTYANSVEGVSQLFLAAEDQEVAEAEEQEEEEVLYRFEYPEADDEVISYIMSDVNNLSTAVTNENTAEGKEGDGKTTTASCKRAGKGFADFLDSRSVDSNKKLYTNIDPDINRVLVRDFLKYYMDSQTSPGLSHIKEALIFLQRKLHDEMAEYGIVCP